MEQPEILQLVDKTSDRIKAILEESESMLKELKMRLARSEQPRLPPSETESEETGEATGEATVEEEEADEEEAEEELGEDEEAEEELGEDEEAEEEEAEEEEAEEEEAEDIDDTDVAYNHPVEFSIWKLICCSRH